MLSICIFRKVNTSIGTIPDTVISTLITASLYFIVSFYNDSQSHQGQSYADSLNRKVQSKNTGIESVST